MRAGSFERGFERADHFLRGCEQVGISIRGEWIVGRAERILFFDFMPMELGTIGGQKVRVQLYTVPGQVFYDATRKLVLRGADGVVFVADSQKERMDANLEALDNLQDNLKEHGYELAKIPYVLQLNKRDLPNVLPVDALKKELLKKNEPVFEAVAFNGTGVFETLKEVARQVLVELKKG